MFWRLGLLEESRPVVAAVWLKVVWMRPSGAISAGRASRYVWASLVSSRQRSIFGITGCSWRIAWSTRASVE